MVTVRNYIDCPQKRALFWAYNGFFGGKNSDIGTNDFRFWVADLKARAQGARHKTQGVRIFEFGTWNVEGGKQKTEVRNGIIWIYNRWISVNCSL
jgi:hypothetical protein